MKLLLIFATLGLATFVVLRRRNPDLADRVQGAVKDAAGTVKDNPLDSAGDIASNLRDKARDKAKDIVG